MDEKNNNLKKLVDSSGYPFQLRIENEIRTADTRWNIITHEHPWKNISNETEGFIDVILGNNATRVVLECKRPRGGVWVFIISREEQVSVERFRICWAHCMPERKDLVDWDDFHVVPGSQESEFCIVRGHGDKTEPFLERLSKCVLSSTEALAHEELSLIRHPEFDRLRFFIPVIVTTAELKVCRLEPNQVSISDGSIKEPKFETVPWIRFRKSLSVYDTDKIGVATLKEITEKKERSIFIMNSTSLSHFLKSLEICSQAWGASPWEKARQIERMQENET